MMAENGLHIDLDAVNQILSEADVLALGFTQFPERLLVDLRTNDREGPLITLVDPVATVQERYLWLGKHRGSFGAPRAFSFFTWPHSFRTLREHAILVPLRARLEEHSSRAARGLDHALAELEAMELAALKRAIRGEEPWKSLWERQR